MLEELETLQVARDAAAQVVAALEDRKARLASERDLRSRWLSAIRDSPPRATLPEWQSEASALADAQRRAVLQRQGRLADLKERADDLSVRLGETDLDARMRQALERRREAIDALIAFHAEDVEDVTRHEKLERRFLQSLQDESGQVPLRDRLASAWRSAVDLSEYELTTVDDEPITVGNAFLALLLVGLGFTVSRRISLGVRHLIDTTAPYRARCRWRHPDGDLLHPDRRLCA